MKQIGVDKSDEERWGPKFFSGSNGNYLSLQCNGVDGPRLCSDMVDDVVSKAPLVEEGFWPAQVRNQAGEGQFGAFNNLLATPHQCGIAWLKCEWKLLLL